MDGWNQLRRRDGVHLPVIAANRKYYGTAFALRITALMFVTMVMTALIVDLLYSGLGLITHERPSTKDVFGSVEGDYKLLLNLLGLLVFAALMLLTVRRGVAELLRPRLDSNQGPAD